MKKLVYITLLCTATAFAQLHKANKLYDALAFKEAAEKYEEYLQKQGKPKPETLKNAADAYYNIGESGNALRWYQKLYDMQGEALDSLHFRRYIDALKMEGQLEKADNLLLPWIAKTQGYLNSIEMQKHSLEGYTNNDNILIKNLDSNTLVADFGTAFYGKNLVYTSAKDAKRGGKEYSWNGQPYLALYIAGRNEDGSLKNEKKFLNNAQTDYHNALAAFSPGLETVYVSVNAVDDKGKLQNSKDGTNNIRLVYGNIEGGKLKDKRLAPFCNIRYSVGQAAVSEDGRWLYFVSDMPGGYGSTDIYRAEIYENGTLGAPHNLGPHINTLGREMFPFVKNGILYFASDGYYTLGGLDIFKVPVKNADAESKTFMLPQNLGAPFNSNRDDFAYIVDENGNGYFSSNREGGKGDDDIYYFYKDNKPCEQLITGKVINKKDNTPIPGVTITAAYNGKEQSVQSGADGSYSLTLPCEAEANIQATKEGYTKGSKNADPTAPDFELQAFKDLVTKEGDVEKVAINPIYFDFDEYYITPQAAAELDKVVFVMEQFPNVKIKIESHTDSRGNDAYNLRLSDDRAKSTYSYIVAKGISPARILSVKGYGETQLLNNCGNGADCTEEAHQLNRRSNFIIAEK